MRTCLALLVVGVLVSCGVMDENPGSRPDTGESSWETDAGEPPSLTTDSPLESRASVAEGDVSTAASEITGELQSEEQFASVEVIDRQKIRVRWFGEPTPQMQDVLDKFPQLDITVDQVSCSPGHVREFGEGLLQTDPNVRAFSLEPDGSSANVILDESLRAISEVSDLEHRYSEAADCPIRVSFGSTQPAL
ncbi:hypothetical protein D6T63_11070 [Arthrobacter cheniae]|uniref:FtsX extracellular domain-containing protein n=1 Tax=Arthrobacter cheniae TaxID=1258888 RepID=A0A3A5M567_9MICC|nr:hypothetical protein D6T63_11070 [Arthrobacter cheniae]